MSISPPVEMRVEVHLTVDGPNTSEMREIVRKAVTRALCLKLPLDIRVQDVVVPESQARRRTDVLVDGQSER